MNNPLLQKASIVLSPTAYGTGTLNSIKPDYALGPELVTNGTFDTDSNWTKTTGWTISGGKANRSGASSNSYIAQDIDVISGRNYIIKYDRTYVSGDGQTNLFSYFEGSSSRSTRGNYDDQTVETVTVTDYFKPEHTGNLSLRVYGISDFTGSVDNVSIKEIKDADFDFTRNTTATRVNESGLIETVAINTPRINFTSGVGSILLESDMTNHYLKSEAFDNFQGTIALNNATSPTGATNAAKLTKTSASDQFLNLSWSGTTISTSKAYTMSLFVKHNGDDIDVRYEYNNSSDWGVTWTALFLVRASGTTASTVANCTSKVEDFGNGWYRISCTFTTASSVTATSPANLVRIIGGDTETILVFGAQMEKFEAPTSYIRTSGSAVTRGADVANNAANSDLINSPEGVLYLEIAFNNFTNNQIALSDGSANNRVTFTSSGTTNRFKAQVKVGGTTVFSGHASAIDNTENFNKYAIKWKENDFALWCNGTEKETDTSGSSFSAGTLNTLLFDRGDGSNDFYGKVKVLAVFKEALTDAELTTLTS